MVTVTFKFQPEDPDSLSPTGMAQEEYEDLVDRLAELGAEDVRVERVHEEG